MVVDGTLESSDEEGALFSTKPLQKMQGKDGVLKTAVTGQPARASHPVK